MPMMTTFTRDGERLRFPHGWGRWHLSVLREAMIAEGADGEKDFFAFFPLKPYTFTEDHTYTDPTDGEVLNIRAGDVYKAWRD